MPDPAPSPFVGPRPLELGEPCHGRSREIADLLAMLRARRVVILHGGSGVGKSSLVRAGLAPLLREADMDVWKPMRIHGELERFSSVPAGHNPYLLSAMVSLEDELPIKRRRSPSELAQLSFVDYVESRPRRKGRGDQRAVLIFDQLGELFAPRGATKDTCSEFFREIGRALENEKLWALFIIDDELFARLTLYHQWVPGQMSNTYHLDPLARGTAKQVIQELAGSGGREFEQLDAFVERLSRLAHEDGEDHAHERGGFVDPSALQATCRRLWGRTPGSDGLVETEGIEIGEPLGSYYAAALRRIVHDDRDAERQLRNAIARLYTARGRRNQQRADTRPPANLEPEVIERLLDYDILRVESWGEDRWLELGHTRLARALIANNAKWERAHPATLDRLGQLVPTWSKFAPDGEHPGQARGTSTPVDEFDASERTLRRSAAPSERAWATVTGEWDVAEIRALLDRSPDDDAAPPPEAPAEASAAPPGELEAAEAETPPTEDAGPADSESSATEIAEPEPPSEAESLELTEPQPQPQPKAPREPSPRSKQGSAFALASALLRITHNHGDTAHLDLALACLGATDAHWALSAAIWLRERDDEALLGQLELMLRKLAPTQVYAALPAEQHPDLATLVTALLDLGQALAQATGAQGRALLAAAFRARFSPRFFPAGLDSTLWSLARTLELPELHLLSELADPPAPSSESDSGPSPLADFLYDRLARRGLVEGRRGLGPLPEISMQLLEFLRAGGLPLLLPRPD